MALIKFNVAKRGHVRTNNSNMDQEITTRTLIRNTSGQPYSLASDEISHVSFIFLQSSSDEQLDHGSLPRWVRDKSTNPCTKKIITMSCLFLNKITYQCFDLISSTRCLSPMNINAKEGWGSYNLSLLRRPRSG